MMTQDLHSAMKEKRTKELLDEVGNIERLLVEKGITIQEAQAIFQTILAHQNTMKVVEVKNA